MFWLGRWGPSGLQQLRRSYETPLGVWTVSFQPAKVAPPSEVMSSDVAPSAKMSRGMVSTSKYTLHKIARLISTYGSTGIPRSSYPHQKAFADTPSYRYEGTFKKIKEWNTKQGSVWNVWITTDLRVCYLLLIPINSGCYPWCPEKSRIRFEAQLLRRNTSRWPLNQLACCNPGWS